MYTIGQPVLNALLPWAGMLLGISIFGLFGAALIEWFANFLGFASGEENSDFEYETDLMNWYKEVYGEKRGMERFWITHLFRNMPKKRDYF